MRSDAWYCAGWSRELAARAVGRTLLGSHVVLFRDGNGTARALGARCPHRGADLASGAVVEGCIQCPFHGWRFDGSGQCVRVPSQPESVKISSMAHVPSFPLHEYQGTLWIWMGAQGTQGPEPPRDAIQRRGQSVRRLYLDARLIEAPFLTVLENAFDKAHLPFIHRGTFGPDQDPLVARQRITVDADGGGLRSEDDPSSPWHAEVSLPGGWIGRLARLLVGLRRPIAQHTRFDVGGIAQQTYIEYPDGTYDLFVAHITPADEERTWLFVQSVRTRAPHSIGDWVQRRVLSRLFEEGNRETSLILDPGPDEPRPVSVESDRVGIAARRLYERWDRGSGTSVGAGDQPDGGGRVRL